jgi:hypothetical protein
MALATYGVLKCRALGRTIDPATNDIELRCTRAFASQITIDCLGLGCCFLLPTDGT